MPHSAAPRALALAVVALATGAPAAAQEVRWRHDYAAARREAAATGRPLLIDVGGVDCFYCKKLDGTTLRDPAVVRRLNAEFVPVKVDGDRDPRLTAGLGVEGYPTLIVATPAGAVVGRKAGYADVAQLMGLLNAAPAAPAAGAEADAEKWRRVKARFDADLAALHPQFAAPLRR